MTAQERLRDPRGELVAFALEGRAGPVTRRLYWGRPWQLGTASYWGELALSCEAPATYRLAPTLADEVAVCLLGGHGMPAAVGLAAYERLSSAGALRHPAGAEDLEALLREPLDVGGAKRRYRFPRQRGARLAAALAHVAATGPPDDDVDMRDWLARAPGIGPKTASWIVRNHRSSDRVAVIDVHVVRAGLAAGAFDASWRLPVDYGLYEQAFLAWARSAGTGAALLDTCIWNALAAAGTGACDILGTSSLSQVPPPVWPCAQPGEAPSSRARRPGTARRVRDRPAARPAARMTGGCT